ncbi:MAG: VWA domain-containing protein, partial [Phycisphaerales bacterium]|nr:VWA domain-containing protein [Phycisphaerales bacterium]
MNRMLTLIAGTLCAVSPVLAGGTECAEAEARAAGEPEVAVVQVATTAPAQAPGSTVQIALLLDTSNSMDGLIDQAKRELWSIVNELALARYEGERPDLQIALYEYGNNGLSAENGYVRMVQPLTDNLDQISQDLFALVTNGGDEYCGQVIGAAATQLQWSDSPDDLKA